MTRFYRAWCVVAMCGVDSQGPVRLGWVRNVAARQGELTYGGVRQARVGLVTDPCGQAVQSWLRCDSVE
jgi:hypothetical protein